MLSRSSTCFYYAVVENVRSKWICPLGLFSITTRSSRVLRRWMRNRSVSWRKINWQLPHWAFSYIYESIGQNKVVQNISYRPARSTCFKCWWRKHAQRDHASSRVFRIAHCRVITVIHDYDLRFALLPLHCQFKFVITMTSSTLFRSTFYIGQY